MAARHKAKDSVRAILILLAREETFFRFLPQASGASGAASGPATLMIHRRRPLVVLALAAREVPTRSS